MFSLRALRTVASRSQPTTTSSSILRSAAQFNKCALRFASTAHFKASPGFIKFSEDRELDIRKRLDALPGAGKIFQNPDGTARSPEDAELKDLASLTFLANDRRLALVDLLRLSSEQIQLYIDNQADLNDYLSNGKRILDKIPVEDPTTGEITWSVIRANEKEGWEPIIYYGFIPALLVAFYFALFLDKEDISEWALEELRLRAQEKYEGDRSELAKESNISPEEIKKRDELIVERILSGDYDRLAGLQKAGAELPSSLI
ncbi:uncharacterized protein SAPINGB_P000419 [Magnusiomyces paraingens]|uniref:Uncharacterized protein n=1 Tax=Magnusiomyces paraingens TaxID=2606893 RepID=A0A5E8B572_9ASCO|nr:uncharacterized protein SAPINGB_P000419 [Saprochaete ingens]VVT44446.1 unnamed protein product [Saprochaete ingens]